MLVFKAKNYIYIQLLFFFIGLLLANDFRWSTNTQKGLQWLMSQKLLRDRDNLLCFVWWKLCEKDENNGDMALISNVDEILREYNMLLTLIANKGRITSPYFLDENHGTTYLKKSYSQLKTLSFMRNKRTKRTFVQNGVQRKTYTNKTFKKRNHGIFFNQSNKVFNFDKKCINAKYKNRDNLKKLSNFPSFLSRIIITNSSCVSLRNFFKHCKCNINGTKLKTNFNVDTPNYSPPLQEYDELKRFPLVYNRSRFEFENSKLRPHQNSVFHPFSYQKYFAKDMLLHKRDIRFRGRTLLGISLDDFSTKEKYNDVNLPDNIKFHLNFANKMMRNDKSSAFRTEYPKKTEVYTNEIGKHRLDGSLNAESLTFSNPNNVLKITKLVQRYETESVNVLNPNHNDLQRKIFPYVSDVTANLKDDIKPTPVQIIQVNSIDYPFSTTEKNVDHKHKFLFKESFHKLPTSQTTLSKNYMKQFKDNFVSTTQLTNDNSINLLHKTNDSVENTHENLGVSDENTSAMYVSNGLKEYSNLTPVRNLTPSTSQIKMQQNDAQIVSGVIDEYRKTDNFNNQITKNHSKQRTENFTTDETYTNTPINEKILSMSHTSYLGTYGTRSGSSTSNSFPFLKDSRTVISIQTNFTPVKNNISKNFMFTNDFKLTKHRVFVPDEYSTLTTDLVLGKSTKLKIPHKYSETYYYPIVTYLFSTPHFSVTTIQNSDSLLKTVNSILLDETALRPPAWLQEKSTDLSLSSVTMNSLSLETGSTKISFFNTQKFPLEKQIDSHAINSIELISPMNFKTTKYQTYTPYNPYPVFKLSKNSNHLIRENLNDQNTNGQLNSNSKTLFPSESVAVFRLTDKFHETESSIKVEDISILENIYSEYIIGQKNKFTQQTISPALIIYQTQSVSLLDLFSTEKLKIKSVETENQGLDINAYLKSSMDFKHDNEGRITIQATNELNKQIYHSLTNVQMELTKDMFITQGVEISSSKHTVPVRNIADFTKIQNSNRLPTIELIQNSESASFQDKQKSLHKSGESKNDILLSTSYHQYVTKVVKNIAGSIIFNLDKDAGTKIYNSENKTTDVKLSTKGTPKTIDEVLSIDKAIEFISSENPTITKEIQANSQKPEDQRSSTPNHYEVDFKEYRVTPAVSKKEKPKRITKSFSSSSESSSETTNSSISYSSLNDTHRSTSSTVKENRIIHIEERVIGINTIDESIIGISKSSNKTFNDSLKLGQSLLNHDQKNQDAEFTTDENNNIITVGNDVTGLEFLETTEKDSENMSPISNGLLLTSDPEDNALIRTEREILSPDDEFYMKPSSEEEIKEIEAIVPNKQEDLVKNLTSISKVNSSNSKLFPINLANKNDSDSSFDATFNKENAHHQSESKNNFFSPVKGDSNSNFEDNFNNSHINGSNHNKTIFYEYVDSTKLFDDFEKGNNAITGTSAGQVVINGGFEMKQYSISHDKTYKTESTENTPVNVEATPKILKPTPVFRLPHALSFDVTDKFSPTSVVPILSINEGSSVMKSAFTNFISSQKIVDDEDTSRNSFLSEDVRTERGTLSPEEEILTEQVFNIDLRFLDEVPKARDLESRIKNDNNLSNYYLPDNNLSNINPTVLRSSFIPIVHSLVINVEQGMNISGMKTIAGHTTNNNEIEVNANVSKVNDDHLDVNTFFGKINVNNQTKSTEKMTFDVEDDTVTVPEFVVSTPIPAFLSSFAVIDQFFPTSSEETEKVDVTGHIVKSEFSEFTHSKVLVNVNNKSPNSILSSDVLIRTEKETLSSNEEILTEPVFNIDGIIPDELPSSRDLDAQFKNKKFPSDNNSTKLSFTGIHSSLTPLNHTSKSSDFNLNFGHKEIISSADKNVGWSINNIENEIKAKIPSQFQKSNLDVNSNIISSNYKIIISATPVNLIKVYETLDIRNKAISEKVVEEILTNSYLEVKHSIIPYNIDYETKSSEIPSSDDDTETPEVKIVNPTPVQTFPRKLDSELTNKLFSTSFLDLNTINKETLNTKSVFTKLITPSQISVQTDNKASISVSTVDVLLRAERETESSNEEVLTEPVFNKDGVSSEEMPSSNDLDILLKNDKDFKKSSPDDSKFSSLPPDLTSEKNDFHPSLGLGHNINNNGVNEVDASTIIGISDLNVKFNIDDNIPVFQNDQTFFTTKKSADDTLEHRNVATSDKTDGERILTSYLPPARDETTPNEKYGDEISEYPSMESLNPEIINPSDIYIDDGNQILLTTHKDTIELDAARESGGIATDKIVAETETSSEFSYSKNENEKDDKYEGESRNYQPKNVGDKRLDGKIAEDNKDVFTTQIIESDNTLESKNMLTTEKNFKEIIPNSDFMPGQENTANKKGESSLIPLKNDADKILNPKSTQTIQTPISTSKLSSEADDLLLPTKTTKTFKNNEETYSIQSSIVTTIFIPSQTTLEDGEQSRNSIPFYDESQNSISSYDESRNSISPDDVSINSILPGDVSIDSILDDDLLIRTERETESSNEEILTEPMLNMDDALDSNEPNLRDLEIRPKYDTLLTTKIFSKIPSPGVSSDLSPSVNISNNTGFIGSFNHEINIDGMGIKANASTKIGTEDLDINFNINGDTRKDGTVETYATTPKDSDDTDSTLENKGVITTNINAMETLSGTEAQPKANKIPRDTKNEEGPLEKPLENVDDLALNSEKVEPTPNFYFFSSSEDVNQLFPTPTIKTSKSTRESVLEEGNNDEQIDSDGQGEMDSKDMLNENNFSTRKNVETVSESSSFTDNAVNVDDSTRTSTTSTSTVIDNESSIIPFHFTIDADYKEVVGKRKKEFEKSLSKQLGVAMRVPLECVQNLTVSKGSIQVDFNLVPSPDHGHMSDEKAMKAAADELKRMIDNGLLNINDLDGNTLVVVPLDPPTKPPPASEMEHTTLILGVIIGAFILTIITVAIAAIVVKRKSSGSSRLSPIEEARSKMPSYREIPFQEALFMKNSVHNKLMLGKYCYDTGKWVGPGPEPRAFQAPDSVVYRPPTDSEIRRTPRPPTAVRERLRNDWELDWDSAVFSR